jgi:hypothetical protein
MIFFLFFIQSLFAQDCHYSYTIWNANLKKSFGPIHVHKQKSELLKNEIGPMNCSVCEEDQVDVILKNKLRVKVCKHLKIQFEKSFNEISSKNFEIQSIKGYRPSLSKGKLNDKGERDEFSNHAFGVAVDINEDFNGLYDHCLTWTPNCKLRKGGAYNPAQPLSIMPNSQIVNIFKSNGFLWGGEIKGNQKDFMHFSLTGY